MTPRDRTAALARRLRDRGGDAAVAYAGPNLLYFGGAYGEPGDRHALLVVPAEGEPRIVASEKAAYGVDDAPVERRSVVAENDPGAVARRLADDLAGADRVLLGPRVPYSVAGPLRDALDGVAFGEAGPLFAECRIAKDDAEVDALDRSAAVADAVSEAVRSLGADAVGRTEADLAAEIRGQLHAAGGTRLSFPPVVAAGPNAAEPYHRNGDREISAGAPVILDFGAFVDGYASDQTRTVVFDGDPPEGFVARHEAVRDALDAGVAAAEPGATVAEVHDAVEATLADHGVADEFVHGTGHGVGVEAHEAPAVAAGNDRELEPGMVFSVEPGCYVDGEYGVRVEDLVVVTEDGARRLNDSPRTWEPL